MQAAVVRTFGVAPRVEEFAEPTPGPDEVLVHVHAAGLHPVVKSLASGSHYGSTPDLPLVPGLDGVGHLDDGRRVYFWRARPLLGTLAERSIAHQSRCARLPDALSDAVAAAIVNPGLSAWFALEVQAQLVAGETVLVLGATGVAGQLAVQLAHRLGAGRVIAAGRNEQVLRNLPALGADAVIRLDRTGAALSEEVVRAASGGLDVIVDYVWGPPTEAVLAAISRSGLTHAAPRVRLVEVGDSAGSTLTLRGALLRSSGLEISGVGAGTIPVDRMLATVPKLLNRVVSGELQVSLDEVPLAEVENAWDRAPNGRRIVLTP
jgi:NADPH2:quinone reductase